MRQVPRITRLVPCAARVVTPAQYGDCLIEGYDPLIDGLKLSDSGDRHVLAAAIKAGAQVIVTSNLKHFPAADLQQWHVEAKSPDEFVLDQIGIDGRTVAACA